ncbi:DUF262 domain-containing protein [Thiothrix nivea]|uniref:GmrSD restriction endonucleases N-terminal domain-containing protein n=1 Tax=Thiothrix nivea (strain ATCC 35100 / DSM 5205 / JP2) TaxID=870187 RepID=A0A656HKH2_THINJ|nr:DUF262 domain-containing protein [Thiothrix nivea]EIJ36987.1 protein of unknown function DUF262 [Thiothrix nivea DSM 5205]
MKNIDELKRIIEQEENIEDESENEDGEEYSRYDITSYGIDFDVDGLVRRLKKNDIFIPEFQRNYVWKLTEASRFIESLLLGLPVPGIFLAQDQATGRMLVIDGQQRLLSLKYFFLGEFNPISGAKSKRVFRLTKVKRDFEGKTYEELDSRDRINLENAVIHATVVKQESPSNDDTSIYHIFERLNSGGRKLTAQEIRVAVYHGKFIDLLKEINTFEPWRNIFGPVNDRMKDLELILRFLAMNEKYNDYTKPMTEFLTKFCSQNRDLSGEKYEYYKEIFKQTIEKFSTSIDDKLFRPSRALNVALFESCMVGLAKCLTSKRNITNDEIKNSYNSLLESIEFQELISQSTSDVKNLKRRMELAINAFAGE